MSNTTAALQDTCTSSPQRITCPNYSPPPGHLGNLTELQRQELETLKKELEKEGHFVAERMDDTTLLRFLRARKFDVLKTKQMLLENVKWRQEFRVDHIVKEFTFTEEDKVNEYYPQYYHKTDKDGRPIYIEQLRILDIDTLYSITTCDRLCKRLVFEYEKFLTNRLPACSRAKGHPVETSCTIMDLTSVSILSFKFLEVQKVLGYVAEAASIGQNHYPETMGKFYVINAPWGFSTTWKLIKGFLDEATVKKINILGSDYKDELLKQVPSESLPKEFGGTCECEGGCSRSDAGPWNTNTYL